MVQGLPGKLQKMMLPRIIQDTSKRVLRIMRVRAKIIKQSLVYWLIIR